MEISAIIAINLKRIREERKLSMGQLAEMAGVRGSRTRASSRCPRQMPST